MRCIYCGKIVPNDSKYCPFCGCKLPTGETTAPFRLSFDVNGVAFNMIRVESGSFLMGANENEDAYFAAPAHEVIITDDYYIGETQVTQGLWTAVMGRNPSYFGIDNGSFRDEWMNLPVDNVCFNDCLDFIRELNRQTGIYFRLPTEAEWEFAARGGRMSMGYLYAGSDDVDEVAWNEQNSHGGTHPVALLKPNELGLFDMSGNVDEFCIRDIYGGDVNSLFAGRLNNQNFLEGAVRGGDWFEGIWSCRVFESVPMDENEKHDVDFGSSGLRLVLQN